MWANGGKAGVAILVLFVGFLGGFFSSGKQLEWIQVDAVKSAKELGVALGKVEEQIAAAKKIVMIFFLK